MASPLLSGAIMMAIFQFQVSFSSDGRCIAIDPSAREAISCYEVGNDASRCSDHQGCHWMDDSNATITVTNPHSIRRSDSSDDSSDNTASSSSRSSSDSSTVDRADRDSSDSVHSSDSDHDSSSASHDSSDSDDSGSDDSDEPATASLEAYCSSLTSSECSRADGTTDSDGTELCAWDTVSGKCSAAGGDDDDYDSDSGDSDSDDSDSDDSDSDDSDSDDSDSGDSDSDDSDSDDSDSDGSGSDVSGSGDSDSDDTNRSESSSGWTTSATSLTPLSHWNTSLQSHCPNLTLSECHRDTAPNGTALCRWDSGSGQCHLVMDDGDGRDAATATNSTSTTSKSDSWIPTVTAVFMGAGCLSACVVLLVWCIVEHKICPSSKVSIAPEALVEFQQCAAGQIAQTEEGEPPKRGKNRLSISISLEHLV